MTNGCKVYVCGLSFDPISEVETFLNEVGKESGGSAIGYALTSNPLQIQSLNFSSFPCDLKSEEGILEVSRFVRERETHLDILISNAGIRRDPSIACNPLTASLPELQTSLLSSSYNDWLFSFQVNTMAHYFLSISLLDLLAVAGERTLGDGTKGKENGCGVVVVTRSVILYLFFLGLY